MTPDLYNMLHDSVAAAVRLAGDELAQFKSALDGLAEFYQYHGDISQPDSEWVAA